MYWFQAICEIGYFVAENDNKSVELFLIWQAMLPAFP